VSGVVFAFVLYAPFAMLGIMFIIPMPAILFAVLYVVGSIYALRQGRDGVAGGIAHEAHLGGAVGGVLLTILLDPRSVTVFLRQIESVIG
jgi:membrane associated rhomboid family serine protease